MSKQVYYKLSVDISFNSPKYIVAISAFPLHTLVRYMPSILYTGYIPVREYMLDREGL